SSSKINQHARSHSPPLSQYRPAGSLVRCRHEQLAEPSIPYSLAHFWTRTSLFQADMNYFLFPAITFADPRNNAKPGEDPRVVLVDGILAEITRLFSPDWSIFKNVLIVGAQ